MGIKKEKREEELREASTNVFNIISNK